MVSRLARASEPQYPTDEDEISPFEDACRAVTTRPAAQQDNPGGGDRHGTLEATDDTAEEALPEDDDNNEGLHPADVEEVEEMEAIDLYKAAEEHLYDELGDPNDVEEPTTHYSATRAHVVDVYLPLAFSDIAEAQKTDGFCQTVIVTIADKFKSFFAKGRMVSYVSVIHQFRS